MTMIFRVQNEDGVGPYQACFEKWREGRHDSSDGRPCPWDDGGFSHEELDVLLNFEKNPDKCHLLFGFKTLEDLKKWFKPTELEKLATFGFKIYVVHAQQVWYGNSQVMFYPLKGTKGTVYEDQQETGTGSECSVGDGT